MRGAPTTSMDPDAARQLLLQQHERLRDLLATTDRQLRDLAAGDATAAELETTLDELRRAFREHNDTEEALLVPLLERDAAWGPARIARMIEEHGAEHRLVRAHLDAPLAELVGTMADLVEQITAHMDAEERTFLSPGVLR